MASTGARVLKEGLLAGLIGYAVVALFYAGVDLLTGDSPFRTVRELAGALLGQGEAPGTVEVGDVLAYNGVHLLAFLALGLGAAWLLLETELHPVFWYVSLTVLMAGFLYAVVSMTVLVTRTGSDLSPWTIPAANALAAASAVAYLLRAHPRLMRTLRERGDPEYSVDA